MPIDLLQNEDNISSASVDRYAKFGMHKARPSANQSSGSPGPDDDKLAYVSATKDALGNGPAPSVEKSVMNPYADISPELQAIALNIRKVLQLRHKFLSLSLQGPGDNPKDKQGWRIYPPPPNPAWDENKTRPLGSAACSPQGKSSLMESQPGYAPPVQPRKAGHDIGSDFNLEDLLPLPGLDPHIRCELDELSIFQTGRPGGGGQLQPLVTIPDLGRYYAALTEIQKVSSDGPTKSFAYRQLDILEGKSQLHFLVNSYQETADCKTVPHRDFYNVRKVDTHVHHSACMTQKHLLRFIKSKMKKCPHEVVMFRDGEELTLQQVFDSIKLGAYDLSIDTLDMHVSFAEPAKKVPC